MRRSQLSKYFHKKITNMITHKKTLIRYGILLAMLFIQSCRADPVVTPMLEQPSPVPSTPTVENIEPLPSPTFEPPAGFKPYQDPVVGVSVFVPENLVITGVIPGQYAALQSYPEDKYIGGEGFYPGDTKCDLTIRPPEIDVASQLKR
jgi:hypothetical protein